MAQRCDFSTVLADEFDEHAAALAAAVTRGLVPRVPVLIGAGVLVIAVLSVVIGSWPVSLPWWLDLCLIIALGLVLLLRGLLLAKILESRVLGNSGSTLGEQAHRPVNHVFCATDLNSSRPIYLTTNPPHVFSPAWGAAGKGCGSGIRLGTAVRASAAFPGGLPPKKMSTVDLGFKPTTGQYLELHRTLDFTDIAQQSPAAVYLADGGVWNNIGTDWFLRSTRKQLPADINRRHARQFVVVDASAPILAENRIWYLSFPWLAEIGSISRVLTVQFASTVMSRIDAFRARGKEDPATIDEWVAIARMVDRGPSGIGDPLLWSIPGWAEQVSRGRKSEEELGGWTWRGCNKLHQRTSTVPTTLFRVPPGTALDLLYQGYYATRAALLSKGVKENVLATQSNLPRLAEMVGLKAIQKDDRWFVSRRGETADLAVTAWMTLNEAVKYKETTTLIPIAMEVNEEARRLSTEFRRGREARQEAEHLVEDANSAYATGNFRQAADLYGEFLEFAATEPRLAHRSLTTNDMIKYSIALGRCGDPHGLAVAKSIENSAPEDEMRYGKIVWYVLSRAYAVNGDVAATIRTLRHTDNDRKPEAVDLILAEEAFQGIQNDEAFRAYIEELRRS